MNNKLRTANHYRPYLYFTMLYTLKRTTNRKPQCPVYAVIKHVCLTVLVILEARCSEHSLLNWPKFLYIYDLVTFFYILFLGRRRNPCILHVTLNFLCSVLMRSLVSQINLEGNCQLHWSLVWNKASEKLCLPILSLYNCRVKHGNLEHQY